MSEIGSVLLRVVVGMGGFGVVGWAVLSAVNTFMLPRGVQVRLTNWVFWVVGYFFRLRANKAETYEKRDRIMALFAPTALLFYPVVQLVVVLVGYMGMFWAVQPRPISAVFELSGSSLLTLGFETVESVPHQILEFSEAMLGMILVALLIAYLPTIYSAFSQRETAVAMWESSAGSPPTVAEMIARAHRNGELAHLREVWFSWQTWFAQLEESHTSLSVLPFFRSPHPGRSWITAAGNVLDCAAFILSTVDMPGEPRAAFCIRAGYLSLRSIADFFGIPYRANPKPDEPISISQEEFDQVYDQLAVQGVPLKQDRQKAWHDFAGWRVNYDDVLLQLSAVMMAPYAQWVSDRSVLRY